VHSGWTVSQAGPPCDRLWKNCARRWQQCDAWACARGVVARCAGVVGSPGLYASRPGECCDPECPSHWPPGSARATLARCPGRCLRPFGVDKAFLWLSIRWNASVVLKCANSSFPKRIRSTTYCGIASGPYDSACDVSVHQYEELCFRHDRNSLADMGPQDIGYPIEMNEFLHFK
jgi:hypothetical protein